MEDEFTPIKRPIVLTDDDIEAYVWKKWRMAEIKPKVGQVELEIAGLKQIRDERYWAKFNDLGK